MTAQLRKPDRDGVLRAAGKIAAILPPTPLLPLDIRGTTVWCKAECLQPVGAFKIRGAWHRLSDLDAEARALGVVGVSSGNHAQGVAWAARRLGMAATIVMPRNAPAAKIDATRALGADVVLYERPGEDRDVIAAAIVARTGATLVHAFDDPWVIEGQGSAGIEAAAQLTTLTGTAPARIVACCGGGGLSAGLALACPEAEIVAVEPEGWDDVGRSLIAGTILPVVDEGYPTACDALMTLATRATPFAVLQARGVRGVAVTPEEVEAAMRHAFSTLRLVLEPGGAAALAAVLAGKVPVDAATVVMLTGGNVDPGRFARVIAG